MRSYEAARTYFSIIGFVAWVVIIIGVLVAIVGASSVGRYGVPGAGLVAMVPGVGIGIAGFIQLAFVQMGRAQVDTAEYTQQMLKIARDQLEVSRQALNATNSAPKSFAETARKELPKGGFAKADFSAEAGAKPSFQKPAEIVPPAHVMIEGEKLEHMGQTITFRGGMYEIGGSSFNALSHAKNKAERDFELQKSRQR